MDERGFGPKTTGAGSEVKPEANAKTYTFDDVQGVSSHSSAGSVAECSVAVVFVSSLHLPHLAVKGCELCSLLFHVK